jgi:tetratricopeptide (TPR) repeat protein
VRFHLLQELLHPTRSLTDSDADAVNAALLEHGDKMVADMNGAWEKGYAVETDVEFMKAALDHAKSEHAKAIDSLRDLCKATEPRLRLHNEVHVLKGDCHMALNQPEDAIEDFEEILAIRKNDSGLLTRVIRAYQATIERQSPAVRRVDDLKRARAYVGKLAIIEGDKEIVDYLRGVIYVLNAEQMIALDNDPQAELSVAIDGLNRVLDKSRSAGAHAALAQAYYMEAQMRVKASQDFKDAVEQSLYHCGQAYQSDARRTDMLQLAGTIKQFRDRQTTR